MSYGLKRIVVYIVLQIPVWLWVATSANSGWSWTTAPLLLPFGLVIYMRLHNHYHEDRRIGRAYYELCGILLSIPLGLSWKYFHAHHSLHHAHNNGPLDPATNRDTNGEYLPGWIYLCRNVLAPAVQQTLPYGTFLGRYRLKFDQYAHIDEITRQFARFALLYAFGWQSLMAFVAWTVCIGTFLLYMNYIQHFELPDGAGVVWENETFNFVFADLGYHDQHHHAPSLPHKDLRAMPSSVTPSKKFGLFDPVAFAKFLVSPSSLATYLKAEPAPY